MFFENCSCSLNLVFFCVLCVLMNKTIWELKDSLTTLFEDNAACIGHIKGGYNKGDITKHISPKFFYTHELQKSGEIHVQ